ncbi:MAG: excinuclease ABC subunit C [Acidobacteria bacterium]|nr:excinuclease ABC subunit C [Acidobacteriota bacterium]
MAAPFSFDHSIEFLPGSSDDLLRTIPAGPGVFALRGADAAAQPYLSRTADLRRRLRRLLAPPEAVDEHGLPVLSKRLNLRDRVRFIDYTRTGSDFESNLVLYCASRAAFGPDEARRRLRLHAPYVLRVTMSHEHPRVYSTNRLSKKSLAESFGPFPSRAAADRYCDAVLDLFHLRRCYEDLAPYPDHPGCVYGEMNKCMQPCKQGNPQACTPEQYAHEAERVFAFFTTRGQSMLDEVAAQREAASEAMDFEAAATLHKHWEKVRAASLLADELVRPLNDLRALILQEAAPVGEADAATEDAAAFLLEQGQLVGPERLSTLGVRAVREQTAVGSSLFAQPLMLAPVPLNDPATASTAANEPEGLSSKPQDPEPPQQAPSQLTPEERARVAIDVLNTRISSTVEIADRCDALSLFRRWYYRPEKQRAGEVFLPGPDGSWPIRRVLNGAARVVLGPPLPVDAVDREAAKALKANFKTKIIHAGREGVEREVPVLPKRSRARKHVTPADLAE